MLNLESPGLSQRAGHPPSKLHLLHGTLFDIRCTSFYCSYVEHDNFTDPIVPALAIPKDGPSPVPSATDKTGAEATDSLYAAMKHNGAMRTSERELDISDDNVELPQVDSMDLLRCPKCKAGLMRPGVVWFGEALPEKTIDTVENFIDQSDTIDLMLVIGTSAKVFPAAEYIGRAKRKGARIAVINTDKADTPGQGGPMKVDWFFEGDAGVILPKILESVIGDV